MILTIDACDIPPLGAAITRPLPSGEELLLQTQDLDPAVWAIIGDLTQEAYAAGTRESTFCAYRNYLRWCKEQQRVAVPASLETVLLYFAKWSELVAAQAMRDRNKAIFLLHNYYNYPSPTSHPLVRALLLAHKKNCPKPKPKTPLFHDDIREIVRLTEREPHPLIGMRDRTVILFMFASAQRTAEVEHTSPDWITFFKSGMNITIPESKSDQFRDGQSIFVGRAEDPRFCGVAQLETWLAIYRGTTLFCGANRGGTLRRNAPLSANALRRIIKKYVVKLGYAEADYAGHSTRSGLISSGYEIDVPEEELQTLARHQDIKTTRKYNHPRLGVTNNHSIMRQMGF
jgi:integrase